MAELLVRAKKHWMDDFTQEQIDALDAGKKDSFNARSQIGDIIVVKPDGWKWGKEERPPNFVVIKVPDMTLEEAKKYEEPLMVDDGVDKEGKTKQKMAKHRKHYLEASEVDLVISNGGVMTRTKSDKLKNVKVKDK